MRKKFQKLPITLKFKKSNLIFGYLGLKALESGEISILQIETIRKLLAPFLRKKNKLYWRIFPLYYKTIKSFGSRMGSGKGQLSLNYVKIFKGQYLFELTSFSFFLPKILLKKIHSKINIKTIFISKGL